jgi:TonB family protein
MREQTTKREAGTNWVGAAYENDRGRLGLALVLLLAALTVLVVKDRDFWFGGPDTTTADQTTPEWVPNSVAQTPVAQPAPAKVHVAAIKTATEPPASGRHAVANNHTAIQPAVIPPLEVEVIAGDSRGTVHKSSNPTTIQLTAASRPGEVSSTVAERAPATAAAERVQMSLAKATTTMQPQEIPYPLLGRQMKVQGSVLLQAFIGADGTIRDLRVLSGPPILATAAREAARQWQFKPYLEHGRPVETQAKITVNFTIKVLENGARDQMDTVVALSRGGE